MSRNDLTTGSHDLPISPEYAAIMQGNWADSERTPDPIEAAQWTPARRERLRHAFPGERIIVPSGRLKVRSHDQYYRFRANSAYVWLTGDQTSDGVFVLEPSGEAVLYIRPRSTREDGEFYTDRMYGELWAGRRPSTRESSLALAMEVRDVRRLSFDGPARVLRGVDAFVDSSGRSCRRRP